MKVRPAEPADELGVRRVLDAAMLDFSLTDAKTVLVAESEENVLGALVLSPHERGGGAHIDAVAVRRARRDEGVGTALVEAAGERHAPLTVDCRPGVRPFYDALEFRCIEVENRAYGVRP